MKRITAGAENMKAINIAAVALIVAGGLGLAYGSFSFTKETQEARIGPLALTVQERETVNIPQWAGIAAIVAGALLLIVAPKTS
jgi:multidrug transporter EmrE-like cation transporter